MSSKAVLEQKQAEVAVIADKIKKAKSVVFVDYRGVTVAQDTELRNELRKNKVEYKVLKNKLVIKALAKLSIAGLDKTLEGPTAFAFGYDDPVTPAKILSEAIKTQKKMAFKGGIVEGKVMDAASIGAVASIPSKPVLLAQLLGLLTNPMRSLAVAMDQIAQKK